MASSSPLIRRAALGIIAALGLIVGACASGDSNGATGLGAGDGPPPDADGPTAIPQARTDRTNPEPAGTDEPTDESAIEPARGENELPKVDVTDVATGETVNLASFAPADKPIVLWFWAPH